MTTGRPKAPLNPTAAAILGLLQETPLTGSEVTREAQKWLAPYWPMTRSQIYRELPDLEERGYLKSGKPGSRGALPYKLTAAGRKAFKKWLLSDPDKDTIRNQVALRICFAPYYPDGGLRGLFDWALNYHELALADAAQRLKEAEAEGLTADAAALRFAVRYHQTTWAWLEDLDIKDL